MSPVLPLSSARLTPRRRPVRRPVVAFLPFCPDEPNPEPEAPLARGEAGGCLRSPESSAADRPPPQLQTPPPPLAGIPRLPANSPACETEPQSREKAAYFLCPVNSTVKPALTNPVP